MQTYQQTFAAAQVWELYVTGRYFTTLECTQPINVRFYKGGQLLDAGAINGLMSGLEMTLGNIEDRTPAFDRVQIDVQAGDTVKIGIGNGQGRYNRGAASVTITQGKVAQTGAFANVQKTVTNVTGQLLAANTARQYMLIQNKDTAGNLYVSFGAGAATVANGVRIIPGGAFELVGVCSTQAIQAIGDIASNANVVTVEG
jgi:hypothetical protein